MDTGNSFGGGNLEIDNTKREQASANDAPNSFEQLPQTQNIEVPFQAGRETEQAISSQEAQAVAFPQQPVLQQSQQPAPPQSQINATDKRPTVAGHSDRIEKTWIEKGNAIIQDTKDDPHSQKERFDDLKDEYQAARYGEGENAA